MGSSSLYVVDDSVIRRFLAKCPRDHIWIVEEKRHSGTGGQVIPRTGDLCHFCLVEQFGITVSTQLTDVGAAAPEEV